MVPSGSNSITAWERETAASCEAASTARSFSAVMSVANFTTLKGLPSMSRIGL